MSETAASDLNGGDGANLAESADRRALGTDAMNRRIIARLQEDGRMPYSVIGSPRAPIWSFPTAFLQAN